MIPAYIIWTVLVVVFSYGFVDPNLTLSSDWYRPIHRYLSQLAYGNRYLAAGIFACLITASWVLYARMIRKDAVSQIRFQTARNLVIAIYALLSLSYPFTSYDVFNYIMTAKVAYKYRENPYITMPVEIPNEEGLVYTRAANKTALYGPVFVALTYFPHIFGGGYIWLTLVLFKLMVAVFGLAVVWLIWKITGSVYNALWFGLNPLVMLEVAVNGHNDAVMMLPALSGMALISHRSSVKKIWSWTLLTLSVMVKAAAISLAPVFLLPSFSRIFHLSPISMRIILYRTAFWMMLLLSLIAAPLREELYPWYAVWFLSIAALLPVKKYPQEIGLSLALSIGLELRHLPYMAMGRYDGQGPWLRLLLTAVPVVLFLFYRLFRINERELLNSRSAMKHLK